MRFATAEELGLYIKDLRASRKLSQATLAEEAGVSRRWLASLESGKGTVELGLVLRVASALGLTMHVLSDVDARITPAETYRSLDRRP